MKFTTNLDNLKIIFSLEGSWKFDTGTKNEWEEQVAGNFWKK